MATERVINSEFDNKVIEDIRKIRFGRVFQDIAVLKTKNYVYYAKTTNGLVKSKNLNEVLKANNMDCNKIIYVDADSNRGYTKFTRYYFEPQNKYFYMARFTVVNQPTGNREGSALDVSHVIILKIYPTKKFDWFQNIYEFSEYVTKQTYPNSINERKKITWFYNGTELGIKTIPKFVDVHSWTRTTRNRIVEFFRANGENELSLTSFPTDQWEFNEYMKKAPVANNKALETRAGLIQNIFAPMYKSAKEKLLEITKKKSSDKEEFLKTHDKYSSTYGWKEHRPVLIRHNEWLMMATGFSDWTPVIFYNVEKKTKYLTYIKGGEVSNIAVFNLENLRFWPTDGRSMQYFVAEVYSPSSYYDYRAFVYDDYMYAETVKMYNIDGKEISYKECLDGTPVISELEFVKDKIGVFALQTFVDRMEKETTNIRYSAITENIKHIDYNQLTIGKLLEQNRLPIMFFISLCLKKDYWLAAEQLAKSGYLNIFRTMINDQNCFKSSTEECGYWRNIIIFDKNKTNVKDCFGLSKAQLKAVDIWLGNKEFGQSLNALSVPVIIFGKEKTKMIDQETFLDYLNYFGKHSFSLQQIQTLVTNLQDARLGNVTNSPKELLTIFQKADNLNIWSDYLRMRNQIQKLVDNGRIEIDMKNYKAIPDKSKSDVILRDRVLRYPWGGEVVEKKENLYQEYTRKYKNVEIVNERGSSMGIVVDMDVKETIKFLHDELSNIVTLYRNEANEELFAEAIKRVKKYEWENDKISIIAPEKTSDIINEASALSHCVASFINPIIDGTENVMFIRKKNMKNCPWYTMAIDNRGNIEQIHNYRNGNLTIESQENAFKASNLPSYSEKIELLPILKKWAKERGVNPASIKEAYGALGAHRG